MQPQPLTYWFAFCPLKSELALILLQAILLCVFWVQLLGVIETGDGSPEHAKLLKPKHT